MRFSDARRVNYKSRRLHEELFRTHGSSSFKACAIPLLPTDPGDVMPSLLDAADAFSKLGKKSLEIREAACVRVRHRHASCRACTRVCAHDAIKFEDNVLEVDIALCTGCGACASACPTEALSLVEDADALVRHAVDNAEPPSTITLSCEYARNQQAAYLTDPTVKRMIDRSIALPCLAAIDESTLVYATRAGIALRYLTADCAKCPNRCGVLIEDIACQATKLLERFVSSCDDQTSAIQPPHWSVLHERVDEQTADTSPEMSRRGMFDHLVARTTDSVAEAAVGTFYVTKHAGDEQPSLAESLVESKGVLKTIEVERNTLILDELYRLHPNVAIDHALDQERCIDTTENQPIPTRLFGEALLDAERCDLCGICMTFCPTRALTGLAAPPINPFVAATRGSTPKGELWFRANDCVNCRLCTDICPHDAIDIRSGIAKKDLFALDPRALLIS